MPISYKNIEWKLYNNVLIPGVPPHIAINLTNKEAKKLVKDTNAYFIRWPTDFNSSNETNFWYIIKDSFEELDDMKKNKRRDIKKGLNNFSVKIVSKDYIADNGFDIYVKVLDRYDINPNITEEEYKKEIYNHNGNYDFWGIFYKENNEFIGYCYNKVAQNCCEYFVEKIIPEYLKYHASYADIYVMNQYYLKEKKLNYINAGARCLNHDTNVQDFLISKFNFRKAYCKLNIIYSFKIKLLVKIIYPFRKLIKKSNNKYLKKVNVLLMHEYILREDKQLMKE